MLPATITIIIPVLKLILTSDQVVKEGKIWYWCPHLKRTGDFDGLYVTHHPDNHDEWAERKATFKNHRKNKTTDKPSTESTGENSSNSTNEKLILKDSMKTALLFYFDISDVQVNEILQQAHENSDFQ